MSFKCHFSLKGMPCFSNYRQDYLKEISFVEVIGTYHLGSCYKLDTLNHLTNLELHFCKERLNT